MKSKKELIEIIGSQTALKFVYLEGGVAQYQTCIPINYKGDLVFFHIQVYHDINALCDFETAKHLLSEYELFDVSTQEISSLSFTECLYNNKHDNNYKLN